MLFLLLRISTISISKDIVSYKDQRKDNKYKYKYKLQNILMGWGFEVMCEQWISEGQGR